jgi:N-acetylmuramic acid 6-phosphate etherase
MNKAIEDFGRLDTEQRNPRTSDLDALSTADLLATLHAENAVVQEAVSAALPAVCLVVDAVSERLARGGRLFYVGAGTSGRLGVLDASECPPTFGVPPEMVQGIIAGGYPALTGAVEAVEDDVEAGAREAQARGVGERDAMIGIAASGRTPFVIGALRQARAAGAFTAALSNVSIPAIGAHADVTILAVTGPEALTGSTRLKAGTAQKLILNLISTAAMIRIGKVYGNLMVDVRATNEKLQDRAERIVMEAADVNRAEAETALAGCGYEVKTAIVALTLRVGADEARSCLEAAGGHVRKALLDS